MNNIEIQLPQLLQEREERLSCSKVGSMYNGEFILENEYQESRVELNDLKTAMELEAAARKLTEYEKSGEVQNIREDGTVLFDDLEDGVYLIRSYESNGGMRPTLVFAPTWIEDQGVMLRDITVIPKMDDTPEMGDKDWGGIASICMMSVLFIFLVLFRRKHLRKRKNCDTMQ